MISIHSVNTDSSLEKLLQLLEGKKDRGVMSDQNAIDGSAFVTVQPKETIVIP